MFLKTQQNLENLVHNQLLEEATRIDSRKKAKIACSGDNITKVAPKLVLDCVLVLNRND